MRPFSIYSFPSIVPVAGIFKLWKVYALFFWWSGLPLYALPTLLDPPHSPWRRSLRKERDVALVAPLWPPIPWFLKFVISSGGTSQSSPSPEGTLSTYLCLVNRIRDYRESTSHTLPAFREKGKQAGISVRATEHLAEALRESTRASFFDSRLECFFEWCKSV